MGKVKRNLLRAGIATGLKRDDNESVVDRESRIIYGASVLSIGELIGHDMEADETTLDQVVEVGNARGQGIKARFGHPAMSANAEGSFLGRMKNFRRDGDRVRGDLHLNDVAFQEDGPLNNIGEYTLGLAEKDPEMFGVSIVVDAERVYRRDEDGTLLEDDEGNVLPALLRVKKLWAADVVDEPATGDGLFSKQVLLSAGFTEQLDKLLDEPDALETAKKFLARYRALRLDEGRNTKHIDTLLSMFNRPEATNSAGVAEGTTLTVGENTMGLQNQEHNNGQQGDTAIQQQQNASKAELEEARKEAAQKAALAERKRIDTIKKLGAKVGAKPEGVDKLIDNGTPIEGAAEEFAKLENAGLTPATGSASAAVSADERDKFRKGVTNAMLARGGVMSGAEAAGERRSEFAGWGPQAFARECLDRAGVTGVHRMSGEEVYSALCARLEEERIFSRLGSHEQFAAAAQGTGDFTNVLANVLNKSMGKGWETAPVTYPIWTGTGTTNDFKTFKHVRLSEFSDVDVIPENAAPEFGRMADSYEEGYLFTIGKAWTLSRQAMVNDDIGVLTRVPQKFTRSVRRYINRYVYQTVLYSSSFTGPTLNEDSAAMFSTTRGNLSATGGAPTRSNFDAAYEAMLGFTALAPGDDSSSMYMNVPPRFVLHPPSLATEIYQLLNSAMYAVSGDDGANSGSQIANIWGPGGMRQVVPVQEVLLAHLDNTYAAPWYFAADPADLDTILVYTLNGRDTPEVRSEPSAVTEARGIKYDVTYDFTAMAGDWRGMYCNKGAS